LPVFVREVKIRLAIVERLERSLFSNIVLAHDGAQLGAWLGGRRGEPPPASTDVS